MGFNSGFKGLNTNLYSIFICMCSLNVIHVCTIQWHPVLYACMFVSSQWWLSSWIISEDGNIHLLVYSCECYEMVDFVVFTNRNRREQPSSVIEDKLQSSTLQDLWYCGVHVDLRNCIFLIVRNIYIYIYIYICMFW